MAISNQLVKLVKNQYRLDWQRSIHGVRHISRVITHGRILCELVDGDFELIQLFGLLHDSCRWSEGFDPHHGPRAAKFVEGLDKDLLGINNQRRELLVAAISYHTMVTPDDCPHPFIALAATADRYDISRIGVVTDPNQLLIEEARCPTLIQQAELRVMKSLKLI